jgi:hypothetical protein
MTLVTGLIMTGNQTDLKWNLFMAEEDASEHNKGGVWFELSEDREWRSFGPIECFAYKIFTFIIINLSHTIFILNFIFTVIF